MKIKVMLDRMEEDKAVFITEEKQQIIVPKNLLNDEFEPGRFFTLEIGFDSGKTDEQTKLAKKMLNEIIADNSA